MIPVRPINLSEADMIRFWKKVDQRGLGDCWKWQAGCLFAGYGRFCDCRGSKYLAHRVAFVVTNGDTKLQVCHICNNPSCCNPNHLYAGTQGENIQQCIADGRRAIEDRRGEKAGYVKLIESDVREIRRLYAGGWLQREIAEEYDIHSSTVSAIIRGQNWRHLR